MWAICLRAGERARAGGGCAGREAVRGRSAKIFVKLKLSLTLLRLSLCHQAVLHNPTGVPLKTIIAATALCLAPLTAMAADLGLRKSYPPEAAAAPAPASSTWTGPYAGVNAGGGFGRVRDDYVTPALGGVRTSGALGGLQVGYNYQVGDYVVGIEADYDMAGVKGNISRSADALPWNGYRLTGSASAESRLQSFGTIRARAGVTMNSTLFYATGGYAYGRNKIKAAGTGTYTTGGVTKTLSDAGSDSQTMNGWALGAGVEYAITSKLSGKLEYIYADLGKATIFRGGWAETEASNKVSILRAGVNYRF